MSKISVIVPVYKVEQYLNRCVDSILKQTFTDFELILVDDGSPDNCAQFCDEYALRDKRVRVIHKKNGGLSSARNAGLDVASGKYVLFVDSDDYISDNAFDFVIDYILQDIDLIVGSIIRINEIDGNSVSQTKRNDQIILKEEFGAYIPALLSERRLNYVHAKFYKREIIQHNNLRFEDDMLTSAEDTVFNFTFLPFCRSIGIIGQCIHFYMQHADTLSKKFYNDRYKRHKRLSDFITQKSEELSIRNDAMMRVISDRRVSAAEWVIESIVNNVQLTKKEKVNLLDEIRSDEALKKIIDARLLKSDLTYLINKGSFYFLRYKDVQKKKIKMMSCLSKITPAFIKTTARKIIRKNEKN